MHFYRSTNPIKALTFDLDDTIYDNGPFLAKAEAVFIDSLNQVDGLQDVDKQLYNQFKRQILQQDPEIYHDVLVWRTATTELLLKSKGINDKASITAITDDTMTKFVLWRNKITIPQSSHDILAQLAEKYPLAVITNGNADINLIGLHEYFQFALRGGEHGRSKPFPEIFALASQRLNIDPANILHVGDDLITDVSGGLNAGMQVCWINIFQQDIFHLSAAKQLPHLEIRQLPELDYLL